jgi:hypothetical protein
MADAFGVSLAENLTIFSDRIEPGGVSRRAA